MVDNSRKQRINAFIEKWKDRGDEKQDTQLFWLGFMEDVLGIQDARELIEFEHEVWIAGKPKYIDVLYLKKEILIEQKSKGISLNQRYHQSDGQMLSPYEQARRYAGFLPYGENIRWIVTCNFQTFEIHDLKKQGEAPIIVKLEDLVKDIGLFQFFVMQQDTEIKRELDISIKAGDIVGLLYDALLSKYVDPNNAESQRHLNILITRLVFCMYAEDAGLFGDNTNKFKDYLSSKDPEDLGEALERLFRVLDMPEEIRAKKSNLSPALRAFPYVNGGLFTEEDIEIPLFDQKLADLLIDKACSFDWSEISPTIFGAVFESTLNPETRRTGGMHYTSVENIHKVIDPLFLNELKEEFESIKATSEQRGYTSRLLRFQEKLAGLKFLDPACGSGNFLTETFLSLRRLENLAIAERLFGQQVLGEIFEHNPIKVSIDQFYGIEVNDFAVTVARTALWIAEAQMLEETEGIIRSQIEYFPLKTNASIVEGNALQIDWNDVIRADSLNYIMGNPPFVGQDKKTNAQKEEMQLIFGKGAAETKLDYVICWYKVASEYIKDTKIQVAFVSTSSICQGESVPTLWRHLFEAGITINFAYRPFKWNSEALVVAQVVCVIVGFSYFSKRKKTIYMETNHKQATHINGYLHDADDVWLVTRKNTALNGLPKMTKGSEPTDGGNLFLDADEKQALLSQHPGLSKYIRPFIGGKEFTHNRVGEISRYCLWFKGGNPSEYASIKEIRERLEKIRIQRATSPTDRINKMADYPYLFCQERQPDSDYLLFPRHTSSDRKYIPFGFYSKEYIVGDSCTIAQGISMYEFGILSSNVHMAWTRTVCGRLGDEYRYSQLVYNNFPMPVKTQKNAEIISNSAQQIINARQLYPETTLSDLYTEITMPPELKKAHQTNDMAVMEAYGFFHIDNNGKKIWYKEDETVSALMKMYQNMISK